MIKCYGADGRLIITLDQAICYLQENYHVEEEDPAWIAIQALCRLGEESWEQQLHPETQVSQYDQRNSR